VTARQLEGIVRQAWSDVLAPPEEDMQLMERGWGEAAARAFTGVAPVDVDIRSPGFHAATPLLDLPHRAAAAYLGTYLISLLQSLDFQDSVGLFDDLVTRPHTVNMLTMEHFWEEVIRKNLSRERQQVVATVARFLASKRQALALRDEQVETLLRLARTPE
jgi:hypothetical protein